MLHNVLLGMTGQTFKAQKCNSHYVNERKKQVAAISENRTCTTSIREVALPLNLLRFVQFTILTWFDPIP